MIQSQLVDLVFTGGADNKTDDKNKLFTSFAFMENSRTDKLSAARPRGGIDFKTIESQVEPTRFSQGFGAFSDDKHNVLLAHGLSWRVAPDTDTITSRELISGSEVRGLARRQILGISDQGQVSTAVANKRICTVWRSVSGGESKIFVNVQGFDGTEVVQGYFSEPNAGGVGVQALAVVNMNNTFVVVYDNRGTFKALKVIEQETPVLTALTWASAPLGSDLCWDVFADGDNLYTYADNGSGAPTLYKHQLSGTTLSAVTSTTPGSQSGYNFKAMIKIESMSNGAYLAATCTDGTTARHLEFFDSNLTPIGTRVSTPSTAVTPKTWIAQRDTDRLAFGCTGVNGTKFFTHVRSYYNTTTAVTTNDLAVNLGCDLVCKPIYLDDRLMATVDTHTSPTYGSQALLEYVEGGTITDPGLLAGVSKNLGTFKETVGEQRLPQPVVADSTYIFPVCMVGEVYVSPPSAGTAGTIKVVGITPTVQASLITITQSEYADKMIDSSRNQSVLFGSVPRAVGAYRQIAAAWPEAHLADGNGLTVVAGTRVGTYSFVFAKVLTLPDGTVYRSYGPIQTANLNNHQINYTTNVLDYAIASAPGTATVKIEVYRTTVNGSGIFYLDRSTPGLGTDLFVTSETDLVGNRIADISGGALYPEPAGAIRAITQWKSRTAAVMVDQGTVIKFNTPTNAPQGTVFASGLEVDVGTDGGDITALGAMDHTLYIFKRNSILTLSGDPPGATGENGTLSEATVLRNGMGCIDPRAVILTPRGLMFASQTGFHIIGRNQEWQFIGEGPYDVRGTKVTGMTVDETQCEVYVAYGSSGVWVYNYESQQWYNWALTQTVQGAAIHAGKLTVSTSSGYGNYQKTQLFDRTFDSFGGATSTGIQQRYKTGWLRPDHIRGFQRLRRIYLAAQALQGSTLQLKVYVDYGINAVETHTLPFTQGNNVQFDIHLATQKCEAIAFEFIVPAASLVLSGATLELGVKQGPDKSRSSNITG